MPSSSDSRPAAAPRYVALDGLRGVAAISVVLFHYMACFTPSLVPDYSQAVPWWVDTPVGLLFNGGFAVSLFFVLSGFVLASASAHRKSPLWWDLTARWVRLAGPATASVLIAWGLLRLFPTATERLSATISSGWHRYVLQKSIPGPLHAAYDGLIGNFIHGYSNFNNVLWTMKLELIGSVGIYVFYRTVIERWRLHALLVVLVAMGILGIRPAFIAFVLGAIGCELVGRQIVRMPNRTACGVLVVGVLLAFPAAGFCARWGLSALPGWLQIGQPASIVAPLAAFLMLMAVVQSRTLARPLRSPVGLFLGRVSFPLYLIHVPLLYTLVASSVIALDWFDRPELAAMFGLFLSVSLVAAWAFERWIDAPLLGLSTRVRRLVVAR